MIKIAYFTDGNSIHTQKWISYFAQQKNFDIRLFSTKKITDNQLQETYQKLGIKIEYFIDSEPIPLFGKPIVYLLNCFQAWQKTVGKKYDFIHVHYLTFNALYSLCARKKKLICTVWGSDVWQAPRKYKSLAWIVKKSLKKADLITASDEELLTHIQKFYQINFNRLKLIQHGVKTDLFFKFPETKMLQLRKKYNFTKQDFILLSPRAVQPLYNTELILQSLKKLQPQFPNLKVIQLVYNCDSRYLERLKKLIIDYQLESNFLWQKPVENEQQMPELYNLTQGVITLAKTDNGPLCALEAAACEKPILTYPVNANLKKFKKIQPQFTISDFTVSKLEQAITNLLKTSDQELKKIGEKNRRLVEEEYRYGQNMEKMRALIL